MTLKLVLKLVLKPVLIGNKSFPDSHAEQPCHGGAEVVKQEAVGHRQEVVDEGGDGEDQGELLVLTTAVCSGGRGSGNHYGRSLPRP